MEKQNMSFLAMNFILLFAVIGFILVVFKLSRFAFVFELMLLLVFIFILSFAMFSVYHNKKWGWTILGATLTLLLLDAFFIALLTGAFETSHIATIAFSVIGLLVVLLNLRSAKESDEPVIEDRYEKTEDYYPIDKKEPEKQPEKLKEELKQEIKEEIKKELEEEKAPEKAEVKKAEIRITAKKTAMPKFVASAETKKFHASKCGWAKIMKRKNKVFFNSKKRAQKAGFKAHDCVK